MRSDYLPGRRVIHSPVIFIPLDGSMLDTIVELNQPLGDTRSHDP